jgi:hypothetical protein
MKKTKKNEKQKKKGEKRVLSSIENICFSFEKSTNLLFHSSKVLV